MSIEFNEYDPNDYENPAKLFDSLIEVDFPGDRVKRIATLIMPRYVVSEVITEWGKPSENLTAICSALRQAITAGGPVIGIPAQRKPFVVNPDGSITSSFKLDDSGDWIEATHYFDAENDYAKYVCLYNRTGNVPLDPAAVIINLIVGRNLMLGMRNKLDSEG